jgi:chemotaxis protein CheD
VTAVVARDLKVHRTPHGVMVTDWEAPLSALPATYVHPGQVAISDEAGVLTTILGSCVAVCLHDPKLRVGGLNHYLLPSHSSAPEVAARYGPLAITQLVDSMVAYGAQLKRMTAQIYGGAAVLAAFADERNHLGMRNAQLADEMMREYGIPVIATDIGGNRGRKLTFSPREGMAHIHFIGGRK